MSVPSEPASSAAMCGDIGNCDPWAEPAESLDAELAIDSRLARRCLRFALGVVTRCCRRSVFSACSEPDPAPCWLAAPLARGEGPLVCRLSPPVVVDGWLIRVELVTDGGGMDSGSRGWARGRGDGSSIGAKGGGPA
ncbi:MULTISPECIES: hypothetical protein [Burkholderia]|jgi:hypothetical protein|uniref:hypothetical protein n=1 Tax=Burkholderia TaxID=32008 RepID=UPI0005667B2A|nr:MULTISPECIES: hypothetical protein [Burkholderia]AYQ90148.1 hypothetical protein EDD84_22290 [Burkholderia gladioli]KVM64637.1 hypothetical protein WJ59_19310 [Burkholderia gladioli]NBI47094.1 hypothetical protein [Burkholderia sp. ISTR5]